MLKLIKKLWDKKIARFAVVGSFNTVIDISLLFLITDLLGLPSIISNSMSVSIAITISYFLNHRIVFRQEGGYSFVKYLRFFTITGLGIILIQDTIIALVTDKLWVSKTTTFIILNHAVSAKDTKLLCAKLMAVVFSLIWNYVLYHLVVFKQPKDLQAADEEEILPY